MTLKSYRKALGMIMTLSLVCAIPGYSYAEDSAEQQTAGQTAAQSDSESETGEGMGAPGNGTGSGEMGGPGNGAGPGEMGGPGNGGGPGKVGGPGNGGSPGNMGGGNGGGMSTHTGVGTTELSDGWESFTWTWQDSSGTDQQLEYAVYVPDAYDGSKALPLVTYIGDATYTGAGVAAFAAGECPQSWITEENQEENPCFFLVIGFTESSTDLSEGSQGAQIVPIIDAVTEKYGLDTNRLYLTGQSMGGITDFALNEAYPEKFAATVYVGCQPGQDVSDDQYSDFLANAAFEKQTFVYIASAKDPKAPSGQADLMAALDEKGTTYGLLKDMNYQDIEKSNADAAAVLAKGYAQNFFQFSTVTDSGSSAEEHMESFYYSYELNSIYDWLLQQSL